MNPGSCDFVAFVSSWRSCVFGRALSAGGQRLGLQHVADLFQDPGGFGLGDDVRGHDVEHIAERPQQQAAFEERFRQAWTDLIEVTARCPGFLAGDQLHNSHTAENADVADDRQVPQRLETPSERVLEYRDPLERTGFLEQVEARNTLRAGERVAGVRVTVKKGPRAIVAQERVVDGVCRDGRPQRQIAAGQRL